MMSGEPLDQLHITAFGGLSICRNKEPITGFASRKVEALFVYLACNPRPHSREVLADLFWDNRTQSRALGNLRVALSNLRKQLGDYVLIDRETVQIRPNAAINLDVTQLENGITNAPHAVNAKHLERALALYTGEFLEGVYLKQCKRFETWQTQERERLHQLALSGWQQLIVWCTEASQYADGIAHSNRLLQLDRLSEVGHQHLIQLLALSDQRHQALIQYENCRRLLWDELGILPSARTEDLVCEIRAGRLVESGTDPPAEQSKITAHNIPPPSTPFIGRKDELDDLNGYFDDPATRLITILGPGGMGKTRLAMTVACQQAEAHRFQGGVYFVPLAGIDDPEQIVPAIAAALKIRLEHDEAQLHNILRKKCVLLLLDNFEHLIEGNIIVTRLLQTAPQLRILVTSRERLQLRYEQIYPINGLSDIGPPGKGDAQDLFEQSAQRVRPDFRVSAENESTIDQICMLLGGMPLAIELAASWVDLLPLTAIVDEIRSNIAFLETDWQDTPIRHRSIIACFDVTWKQLPQDAQQLLAQVAVFRNGFSLNAIRHITQTSIRQLANLVDKSILSFDRHNKRYRMHTLLRQYVTEKTVEKNGVFRARHSSYYCNWLTDQLAGLLGSGQAAVAQRIEVDIDNIYAAILNDIEQPAVPALHEAIKSLCEFYRVQGQFHDAIVFLERVRKRFRQQAIQDDLTQFWVTVGLNEFYAHIGRFDMSADNLQLADSLLNDGSAFNIDLREERSFLHFQRGYTQLRQHPQAAVESFRHGLEICESCDNIILLARGYQGFARAARNSGDHALAQHAAKSSVALSEKMQNPIVYLESQIVMGNVTSASGDFETANAWFESCLNPLRRMSHPRLLGLALNCLCISQLSAGEYKAALRTDEESHQLANTYGIDFMRQCRLGITIGMHLGHYERSTLMAHKELQSVIERGDAVEVVNMKQLLGMLALARRKTEEASAYLLSDNRGGDLIKRFRPIHHLLLATIAIQESETNLATAHLIDAIEFILKQGHASKATACLAVAALLFARQEQPARALTLYETALTAPYVANSHWFADVYGQSIQHASADLTSEQILTTKNKERMVNPLHEAEMLLAELKALPLTTALFRPNSKITRC